MIEPFVFPKWTNTIRPLVTVGILAGPVYVAALLWFGATPYTTDVGYQPVQPVPYSHAVHAGQLGMDCRYCHTGVEIAAHASIPPTQTCMGCHSVVFPDSTKLTAVRESFATGLPVEWVRVHDLADFAYFDHSAHVRRGIGCVSCHGRVDKMEVVYQDQPLSMAWCVECHRNPDPNLRPVEAVTVMDYVPPEGQAALAQRLKADYHINPSQDCSTCHR